MCGQHYKHEEDMEYIFRIPIGDWSNDGHGRYIDYYIKSNKPVEHVREMYLQACQTSGISLDGSGKYPAPCAEYENYLFSEQQIKDLIEYGINITDKQREFWTTDCIETYEFCDLVLEFIKVQDPELTLERGMNEKPPMLQFYGWDEQKRHIGYFGYGLFE